MLSFSVIFSALIFNGLLAYFFALMKSTFRDKYSFLAAYVITGRYLLAYLLLAVATSLF
jgi:hypothetical protein